MNKPITKEEFDLVDIDVALAAEEAEKQATKRKRKKLLAASRPWSPSPAAAIKPMTS